MHFTSVLQNPAEILSTSNDMPQSASMPVEGRNSGQVSQQEIWIWDRRNFVGQQPSDTDVALGANKERLLPTGAARQNLNRDTEGNRRVNQSVFRCMSGDRQGNSGIWDTELHICWLTAQHRLRMSIEIPKWFALTEISPSRVLASEITLQAKHSGNLIRYSRLHEGIIVKQIKKFQGRILVVVSEFSIIWALDGW
jgi:hypothetical protein